MNVGIGIYRKEDFDDILALSLDKDNMDSNWEDWKRNKEKAQSDLLKNGIKTIDILVKPKELLKFCRSKGLIVNGESRAQFISYKTQMLFDK